MERRRIEKEKTRAKVVGGTGVDRLRWIKRKQKKRRLKVPNLPLRAPQRGLGQRKHQKDRAQDQRNLGQKKDRRDLDQGQEIDQENLDQGQEIGQRDLDQSREIGQEGLGRESDLEDLGQGPGKG